METLGRQAQPARSAPAIPMAGDRGGGRSHARRAAACGCHPRPLRNDASGSGSAFCQRHYFAATQRTGFRRTVDHAARRVQTNAGQPVAGRLAGVGSVAPCAARASGAAGTPGRRHRARLVRAAALGCCRGCIAPRIARHVCMAGSGPGVAACSSWLPRAPARLHARCLAIRISPRNAPSLS